MTVIVPDAMNDLRWWLRRVPDLVPLVGGRVVFRIRDDTPFPLQRIYRSGGGMRQDGGGTPIQDILLSIECWGAAENGYDAVRAIVAATESAVWQLTSGTRINPTGQTLVVDSIVTNSIDSPDPDTGAPRYILDSRFTVMAAPVPA